LLPLGADPLDLNGGVGVVRLAASEKPLAVQITGLDLLDASGKIAATSESVEEIGVLPTTPAPGSQWGTFMDPTTSPFSGSLEAHRESALKITVKLLRGPTGPVEKCRVKLRVDGQARQVEGTSNGEWPTG
jgi:hypothetical protein